MSKISKNFRKFQKIARVSRSLKKIQKLVEKSNFTEKYKKFKKPHKHQENSKIPKKELIFKKKIKFQKTQIFQKKILMIPKFYKNLYSIATWYLYVIWPRRLQLRIWWIRLCYHRCPCTPTYSVAESPEVVGNFRLTGNTVIMLSHSNCVACASSDFS